MTTTTELDPREKEVWTIDFSSILYNGETLKSIVSVEVSVTGGADPNPAAFVPAQPAPAINTKIVTAYTQGLSGVGQQKVLISPGCCIQGPMGGTGLDGVTYKILAFAQTSNSLRLVGAYILVPVRSL